MPINSADYSASYPNVTKCPTANIPEYAFIGRSNVGKSSLINMICERKKLALTSGKPGKTQMINYFIINKEWYLVDLPGYGYAKISKVMRERFRKMIEGYLQRRTTLQCTFLLIDCNLSPQEIDIEFVNWLGKVRIPFVIVFTKADKSKPEVIEENIASFQKILLETWEELPKQFITSANKRSGRDDIIEYIEDINLKFEEWKNR